MNAAELKNNKYNIYKKEHVKTVGGCYHSFQINII